MPCLPARPAILACLLLLAAPLAQAQDEPLHIGVLAPLSGPFAPLGAQVREGVARGLAFEGVTAQVTAVDDGCDEERGRAAANQLVGAGVDVVIGGVCWRPAVAARDVLAFEAIPFIASGVRYGGLTGPGVAGVLRLAGRDDLQSSDLARAITQGALDTLAGRPVARGDIAILHTEGSYGRTLADGLVAALDAQGLAPALAESFDPEEGLERAAARARTENPVLVVVLAGQADTALMVSALRDAGVAAPLLTGDSAMTAEFPLLAGEAAEGVVFTRPTPWRSLIDEPTRARIEGEGPLLLGLEWPTMAAVQVALARAGGLEGP